MDIILSDSIMDSTLHIYLLMSSTFQVFLFYWFANEMTVQQRNIMDSITESQWYRFTPRAKQALNILMMRSTNPVVLTVTGFVPISLETFVKIMKSAYSFLTMFRYFSLRQEVQ